MANEPAKMPYDIFIIGGGINVNAAGPWIGDVIKNYLRLPAAQDFLRRRVKQVNIIKYRLQFDTGFRLPAKSFTRN